MPSFLLRDTVTVEARSGNTGDGDTYGPAVQLRAYVERSAGRIRALTGRDPKSTSLVILRPGAAVNVGDRLTVDGVARIVDKVSREKAGLRESLVEVQAG